MVKVTKARVDRKGEMNLETMAMEERRKGSKILHLYIV